MAGAEHNYAVLRDGTIASWGSNADGQRTTPAGFELPTTVRWVSASSGDYLTSHQWNGRIPSTALSTAVFDQAGSYTMGFGNTAQAAGLDISAGDVQFDLGSHQYQVGGHIDIGSNATFSSHTGTISSNSLTNNGTLNLGGTISTVGALTNSGTLNVVSGGNLIASSIGGSGTIVNNGTVAGDVTLSGGKLIGAGHFAGEVTVSDGTTLAPGNSVGLLTGTDSVWGGAGKFEFEINDAAGVAGGGVGGNGWDLLQLSGTLNIAATSTNPFLIEVNSLDLFNNSGLAVNFDPNQNYSWTIVDAAGGIYGFSADRFLLSTAGGFQNDIMGGSFGVAQNGNQLAITFSAIPEPSAMLLVGIPAIVLALRRRRGR